MIFLCLSTGCETEEIMPIAPSVAEAYSTGVSPVSFEAHWKSFPQVDYYTLEVALESDFQSLINEAYPMSVKETSLRISNLNPETTYYFRVGAYTISGTFINYSEPVEVNTLKLNEPQALESPEQDLNHIKAAWTPVEEAEGYRLQLAEDINFERIIRTYENTGRQDTVQLIDSLASNRDYFYRVQSTKGNFRSDYSNIVLTSTSRLLQPLMLPPQVITYTTVSLAWETEDIVSSYQLEVGTDPLFRDSEATTYDVELTSNHIELTGLTPNTTYHMRVRSRKDTLFSIYSEVMPFETQVLAAPSNLRLTASDQQQLSVEWDAVPDAKRYEADLAEDSLFRTVLPAYNGYAVDAQSMTFTNLKPGTTYFVRLRSFGFSSYSENSTLKASTLELTAPANISLTSQTLDAFTCSWEESPEAESYLLDVATDTDFTEFLPGYKQKEVLGSSTTVSGFSPETVYYIRLRSKHQDILSEPSATLVVAAAIPQACHISETTWEDGWTETYQYSNGLLAQIEGDSAGVSTSRYRWDIQWNTEGKPEIAERYEADAGGTLLLTETWTYGYTAGKWTSLHRKDAGDATLELIQVYYNSEGLLSRMNSFADEAASLLNYQENYVYQNGEITEAYDDVNQLVRSWKYSGFFNPESLFVKELHALLRNATSKGIWGYVPARAVSVYEFLEGAEMQRRTYVYEDNTRDMPVKVYTNEIQTSKTFNFQSCGF